MILTQKYKFKKRELTDSPPDITATEDNWDRVESELDDQSKQMNVLSDKIKWKPNNWKNENSAPAEFVKDETSVFFTSESFGGVRGCIVKTVAYSNTYAKQEIIDSDATNSNKYRKGKFDDNKWGEWHTVATTDKTEILVTPSSGYTILDNSSVKINNQIFVNIYIKKTDDSIIENTGVICSISKNIPKPTSLATAIFNVSIGYGGLLNDSTQAYCWTNGAIYCHISSNRNAKSLLISGVITL